MEILRLVNFLFCVGLGTWVMFLPPEMQAAVIFVIILFGLILLATGMIIEAYFTK